ncbi:MAG: hypothetical protein NC133_02975 [Prevotella sp.]|nr:hypothetical protein [Prevotella sp.]
MKKFGALCLVVLVAFTLAACRAFDDDSTQTYPQDDPLTMAVFLQVKHPATFSTDLLADWQATVNTLIAQMADDPAAVKITQAKFRETSDEGTYTVDLTLSNVPATTVQKIVRPFKISVKQTVYNPIALLPASDIFTYVVGYTSERRHSAVNTELVDIQDDGNYVYLWTTTEPLEFTNVYPNRPLYYLLVLLGAGVVGVIVYVVARYRVRRQTEIFTDIDCNHVQKPL